VRAPSQPHVGSAYLLVDLTHAFSLLFILLLSLLLSPNNKI
jgi:hypothetical protein